MLVELAPTHNRDDAFHTTETQYGDERKNCSEVTSIIRAPNLSLKLRAVCGLKYPGDGVKAAHRNSDGKNSPTCFAAEGTQDCYTTMLWDKDVTSYAFGAIDPNGATGTIWTAKTPSY